MSQKTIKFSIVLVDFDPNEAVIVACDASPYRLGAVLSHIMGDGSERPTAFVLRTLTPAGKKIFPNWQGDIGSGFWSEKTSPISIWKAVHIIYSHKPLLGYFKENKENLRDQNSKLGGYPICIGIPARISGRKQEWKFRRAEEVVKPYRTRRSSHSRGENNTAGIPGSNSCYVPRKYQVDEKGQIPTTVAKLCEKMVSLRNVRIQKNGTLTSLEDMKWELWKNAYFGEEE